MTSVRGRAALAAPAMLVLALCAALLSAPTAALPAQRTGVAGRPNRKPVVFLYWDITFKEYHAPKVVTDQGVKHYIPCRKKSGGGYTHAGTCLGRLAGERVPITDHGCRVGFVTVGGKKIFLCECWHRLRVPGDPKKQNDQQKKLLADLKAESSSGHAQGPTGTVAVEPPDKEGYRVIIARGPHRHGGDYECICDLQGDNDIHSDYCDDPTPLSELCCIYNPDPEYPDLNFACSHNLFLPKTSVTAAGAGDLVQTYVKSLPKSKGSATRRPAKKKR